MSSWEKLGWLNVNIQNFVSVHAIWSRAIVRLSECVYGAIESSPAEKTQCTVPGVYGADKKQWLLKFWLEASEPLEVSIDSR